MKKETLSEAIGGVEERLIEEAAGTPGRSRRRRTRWAALAACLALVVTGVALFPRMGGSGSSEPPGSTEGNGAAPGFDLYYGPILPLTAAEGGEALTVSRDVTLDFAGGATRAGVTERYTLYNPSEEPVTVTLRYPFVGSLRELETQRPTVTAGDQTADAVLHAGGYAGGDPDRLDSWEDYAALLADGEYLSRAPGEHADLSGIPVIVYRFDDARAASDEEAINPTIRAEFSLDYDETVVLSYGFQGGKYDLESGRMGRSFSIGREGGTIYGTSRYLLVLGEDIDGLTTQGYVTGGWDTERTMETSVNVARYETDLDTALNQIFDLMYRDWIDVEDWPAESDREMWYNLYCDDLSDSGLLSEETANRALEGMLEGLEFALVERVFYLEMQLTIPAGGQTELLFSMEKAGSHQVPGGSRSGKLRPYGYDLATTLGSGLSFERQTARLTNTDGIRLGEQNFGFDLENGITQVELDPGTEHYSLVVLDP